MAVADETAAKGAQATARSEPALLWDSIVVGARPRQSGAEQPAGSDFALISADRQDAAIPADLFVGYQKKVDGVTFGATALLAAAPAMGGGALPADSAQSSYWKFKAGASTNLFEGMHLGVNLQYSPDGASVARDALDFSGSAQDMSAFARALAHNGGVGVGAPPAGVSEASADDLRYDVGLSFNLPYQAKVDLRYYKTLESTSTVCTAGSCPTYFAAALQTKF
jgi:hypothetical protein